MQIHAHINRNNTFGSALWLGLSGLTLPFCLDPSSFPIQQQSQLSEKKGSQADVVHALHALTVALTAVKQSDCDRCDRRLRLKAPLWRTPWGC